MEVCCGVTRLAEFLPIGLFFLFEKYRSSPNFWQHFTLQKVMQYFRQKWVEIHTYWAIFFTKAHLVTLVCCQVSKEQK
jgi:hypothetical protein